MMSDLDSINADFIRQRDVSGRYPKGLRYIVEKSDEVFCLRIEDSKESDEVWKIVDPWAFAAFDYVRKILNAPIKLHFCMREPSKKEIPKCEALRRRLSYLANINKLSVSLKVGGQETHLDTMGKLTDRPENEVIRKDIRDRSDRDTPGRLEKDFQTYLFGKGLHEDEDEKKTRTNERLALFGKDFIFNKERKGKIGIEREFPTGVFDGEVKDDTRLLPTEYIDLVTINTHNEIAIIELKFDDDKLEVIAQLLNYALFFYSYKKQLTELLNKRLNCNCAGFGTKAYLVSNVFHPRFDDVWPYYSRGTIAMQQVVMGYMPGA
jgi:hypothetical protein